MRRQLLRPRRGATIVLVAVCMSLLLGIAALAIDFGRMYMLRTELKVATDAAALSAGRDLRSDSSLAAARDHARDVAKSNLIGAKDTINVPGDSIIPGTWDFTTKTFTAGNWASATAVRVTGSYTASWMLAKIFGVTTRSLSTTSISALGAASTQNCMKPWAIPYAAVLSAIGQDPTNLSYKLTQADITRLENNRTPINITEATVVSSSVPGNFGWTHFPNASSNNNGQPAERAEAVGGCVSDGVSVGDSLPSSQGNTNASVVQAAMYTLCGTTSNGGGNGNGNGNGGGNGNGNGNGNGGGNGNGNNGTPTSATNCTVDPVYVPIYGVGGGSGNNGYFIIQYVGAFKLTGYDFGTTPAKITGYLTSVGGQGGGFKPTLGIVTSSALVR